MSNSQINSFKQLEAEKIKSFAIDEILDLEKIWNNLGNHKGDTSDNDNTDDDNDDYTKSYDDTNDSDDLNNSDAPSESPFQI